MSNPKWDAEIIRLEAHAAHFAIAHLATAVCGVAVDDEVKRDYFAPRLQAILDSHTWARHLRFRIVPMNGAAVVELAAAPPATTAGEGPRP